MEWRFILPVVCILGILLEPGSKAQNLASKAAVTEYNIQISIEETFKQAYTNLSDPETIKLKDNITSQIESVYTHVKDFKRYIIRKFSNGSIVTEGSLEFNLSSNGPNVSELTRVLVDAVTSRNLTIQIKNDSINVTAVTPLFNTSQINVTFSLTDTFTEALSNMSSPEAINLTDKITTQFLAVFKRRYANILRMVIRKFSKGSVVTDGALEFSDLETVPKAKDVVKVIIDAAKANSFNLSIDKKTVSASDSSGVPVTPVFNTSQINVTFSLIDTFTEALSNMSSPEAINLTDKITTQFVSVFKRRYANILRMVIRKFSNGSIVTEGTLEFSDLETVPKAQDVVNVIIDAAKANSFNLSIDKKTVSASDSSGNSATPLFNTSQINVTFSINDTFTDALSILNSTEAKSLTDKITTQFLAVFKRRYANILRMVIRKFSKGSVVTDGALEFSDLETVPKAQEVVNVMVDAVNAGSFNLSIDKKTVSASDSSGSSATPLFNTSQINVTFSLTDTFTDALSNMSSPEAKNLTDKITTQFVSVFKRRYANILRMVIRKFSKGSVVTDGALEFSDLETVPKAQDVVKVIIDAAKANSFNLSIDKKTVSASDSSGVPVTPVFNTSQINVTFSLTDTFTEALSNMSSPEAINLTDKITTQFVSVFKRRYANILRMVIRKFSNGSIVTEGTLEFSDLETVPKAQDVVNVIIDAAKANSFNLSIDKKTVNATDSSGNSATPLFNTSQINVTFSINDTFTDALSILNSTEAKSLTDKITTQFVTVFKRRYANILRMVIRKFSKGSIKTEGTLEFSDLETVPKAQDVVNVIIDAAKANSFNLSIDKQTVSASDSSGNSATPLFNTSQINVTFSLTDTFTEALSNMSSPEAKNLTDNITTQFVTVFKRRYANILRMVIRKFINGSIVTDGALEFSDLETVPKAQDVVNVIIDAAKANSFNLSIDKKTVNATDSSGNSATPLFKTSQINVTFSIIDTFTEALSNISSPEAKNLTDKITTQFVKVFKGRYTNILRMVIRKFIKGSIVTEGTLEFSDLETVPKAKDVVNVIVDAAKANSFNFKVDEKSITATDSSGSVSSHGSSTVISSMFTVLCMALASLLLSGVMHQ